MSPTLECSLQVSVPQPLHDSKHGRVHSLPKSFHVPLIQSAQKNIEVVEKCIENVEKKIEDIIAEGMDDDKKVLSSVNQFLKSSLLQSNLHLFRET